MPTLATLYAAMNGTTMNTLVISAMMNANARK